MSMKSIDAEKLSAQIEKLFPDSSDERIVEGFEYALEAPENMYKTE